MPPTFIFESCFAPYIKSLITEKQRSGFIYESASYHLKVFDRFCIDHDIHDAMVTQELIRSWGTLRETESRVYHAARIFAVRQLALYMTAYGIPCYIPRNFSFKGRTIAHVLTDEELRFFFEQVDSYHPESSIPSFHRLAMEYRVLFRLILCCGLRVSEARNLTSTMADLDKGMLRILQSKGHKDRIVYMPEDLWILCQQYLNRLQKDYRITGEWLFPARDPLEKLQASSINLKFHEFWLKTSCARNYRHHPTVHSLRHTYVVKRMNLWMENGINLEGMMPYLSSYLGHSSVDDTYYYYHQVSEAFRVIREKDTVSSVVIPEVENDEEN